MYPNPFVNHQKRPCHALKPTSLDSSDIYNLCLSSSVPVTIPVIPTLQRHPLSTFPQRLFLFIHQSPSPKDRHLVLNGVDDVADDCEEDEEDDDDDCDDDVCHHHFGGRERFFSVVSRFCCLGVGECARAVGLRED